MLKTTGVAGFQMTFANGWTVSVQFHAGAYCSNRDLTIPWSKTKKTSCNNAEISAWDALDSWYQFEDDVVKGWCSADEVADFIAMVKGF